MPKCSPQRPSPASHHARCDVVTTQEPPDFRLDACPIAVRRLSVKWNRLVWFWGNGYSNRKENILPISIKDRIVDTDWSRLTLGQRIEHLEVEGYVVIPDLLTPDHVALLRNELTRIPTQGADYTEKKQYHNDIQWAGCTISELITHPPTIDFLTELFGDTPIMMTYDYSRSEPGCPVINLHSDGQPWESN